MFRLVTQATLALPNDFTISLDGNTAFIRLGDTFGS